jgi:phage-related protein
LVECAAYNRNPDSWARSTGQCRHAGRRSARSRLIHPVVALEENELLIRQADADQGKAQSDERRRAQDTLESGGDSLRTIYAVQIGDDLWVIDAFQKKSKSGIKTPQVDVDRIKERIKRLKEALR